jgi:aminoglycoside/choline kinase family phosphotransferase
MCLQRNRSPTITTTTTKSQQADERLGAIRDWIQRFDDIATAELTPASGDASFRRYFRARQNGVSRIIMDAPPDREDCAPFITIAGYLEAMQLSAPRVLAADPDQGFLLLSDLGSRQYLDALQQQPGSADALYHDAIGALETMQASGTEFQAALPPYDEKLLRFELSLFSDWLCGRYLDLVFSAEDQKRWAAACNLLIDNALVQARVFVHRDYHSRNLMLLDEGNPGILDFQDAVEGPYTYDLVSLLKDCYIAWPRQQVLALATGFFSARRQYLPGTIDEHTFLRHFELMGVQRQLKAAGIFARLNLRDGKPAYMRDIPRTLAYVLEVAPAYGELDWLARLIETRVLPGLADPPA